MQPSRRATLGLFGTAAVTLVSGCSAAGMGDSGSTPQSKPTDGADGPSEARTPDSSAETDTGSETDAGAESGTDDVRAAVEMRLVGPETDRTLFTGDDVARVGPVQQHQGSHGLPIVLSDDATAAVSETFRSAGVAENREAFEFVLRHRGEELSRFGIAGGLARDIADGDWEGEFLLMTGERAEAEELRETLRTE